MKDSDNNPVVDTSPTSEVVSALSEETDKAHDAYKEVLDSGDVDAIKAAYETYSDLDNKRLQFDRAVEAAKEVLDPS
jgi:hypothetical protein